MNFRSISLVLGVVVAGTGQALAESPPAPPAGFRWEPIEELTDEFNGDTLDAAKWYDHNPKWAGRPPGKFVPSAISVKEGCLQIKVSPLEPSEGEFTIACGAVQSKFRDVRFGYYECRMKASKLSTASVFWMFGEPVELSEGRLIQELGIQMAIGDSKDFSSHMKSNAMSALKKPGEKKVKAKATNRAELKSGVADEFHTYGCWWVDANTMKFYLDGEYVYTIKPATDFDPTPFRHPLAINLACETLDGLPEPSSDQLLDSEKTQPFMILLDPTNW